MMLAAIYLLLGTMILVGWGNDFPLFVIGALFVVLGFARLLLAGRS